VPAAARDSDGDFGVDLYYNITPNLLNPRIYLVNNLQYDSVTGQIGWQGRFRDGGAAYRRTPEQAHGGGAFPGQQCLGSPGVAPLTPSRRVRWPPATGPGYRGKFSIA
jgi:hypothetical protein